jgi:hypothetical protein
MAANKDPHTAERLKKFQDFCREKGWQSDSGRWLVTEAAAFFKRKPNQISDYLNGTAKSFGPTAANALAKDADLREFIFEPDAAAGGLSPVAYELARTFDNFGFDEKTEDAAYNAAVAALVKFLKPKNAT